MSGARRRLSPFSPIADRLAFRTIVDEQSGCWNWTGAHRRNYGVIRLEGTNLMAHRMSWQLKNGPIPEGMFVCHHCDNPRCINPDHLFLGTARDNTRDMIRKGRRVVAVPRGDASPTTKLSDAAVAEARELARSGISKADLARRFGLSKSRMTAIVNGKARNLAAMQGSR